MAIRRGRFRMGTVLLALALLAGPLGSAPLPVHGAGAGADRAGAAADGEEARLLQELIALDWEREQAERRLAALRREERALGEEIARAQARLDALGAERAELRRKAGRFLRLLYEEGRFSLLAVLLQAEDFADFLRRYELIERVLTRNVGALRRLDQVHREVLTAEERLAARSAELARRVRQEAALEADRERLRRELERQLAEARRGLEGDRAVAALVEGGWSALLPGLARFLSRFSDLPWQAIEPDRVALQWAPPGVLVEVSEESLQRGLAAADPDVASLDFELHRGEIAIRPAGRAGGGSGGVPFVLRGSLALEGGRIRLAPSALEVLGRPLTAEQLAAVMAAYDLTFELPPPAGGLGLAEARVEEGRLLLAFREGGPGAGANRSMGRGGR